MKQLIYKIPVLLTLILFVRCTEDFVDLRPMAGGTTNNFYIDESRINATVTAAYAELCAREVFDKDYFMVVGSLPADDVECGGDYLGDYPIAEAYDQFIHTLNDEGPLLEIYRYCYKGIRMCNTARIYLDQAESINPEITDEFVAVRTGEVQFLSAWYHFTLAQVFGGVPVVPRALQPSEAFIPRSTIKEVYTFCENNLKEAIEVLPLKSQVGSERGRATKGAAQALLSRILLYESSYARNYPGDERFAGCQERWQEALDFAEDVIESSEYSLVGIDGTRFASWRTDTFGGTIDGYRWLFTVDGDNSSEGIFEIQSVQDALGYAITRGNVTTVYQTVRKYVNPVTSAIMDYGGWSFNCPTEHLINAFANSDPRESNLHSSPCDETDDPRFATTVGREGDSIVNPTSTDGFVQMSFINLPTGTIGRKFECSPGEYWEQPVWEGPFNVRLIRYAEVCLIAAEAAIMLNDQDKAQDYVNMIRTRARNCGTTGYPQDLTAVSFEDIVHERRLELALEPHRIFDLIRWGLAEEFLDGLRIAALGANFSVDFVPGKHEFWPLPITEIQLSQGTLVNYSEWQ